MTHALFVDLTRTDRLVGPTPLSFLVDNVYVVKHGLAEKHWNIAIPLYDSRDRVKCREIQARGGLGVAFIAFRISGPNGTSIFWFQRFEVEDPVSRAPSIPDWKELVKKVANREVPPSAVRKFLAPHDLANSIPVQPVGEVDFFQPPPLRPEAAGKPRRKLRQTLK